jgi:hypothetical protein
MLVVPCKLSSSQRPLHQVLVSFRGLPEEYAIKAAPDAILRGVGYTSGLLVSQVFHGVDPRRPLCSDGWVCAWVTPPPNDLTLALLPPSLPLGGRDDALLEAFVSSRGGNIAT